LTRCLVETTGEAIGNKQKQFEEDAARRELLGLPALSPEQAEAKRKEEQAKRSNDEILDNTIRMAAQAREIGNESLGKLQHQTEQLQDTDRTLDRMNEGLSRSERLVRSLRSLGGTFVNAVTRAPKHKSKAHASTQERFAPKDPEEPVRQESPISQSQEYKVPAHAYAADPYQQPVTSSSSSSSRNSRDRRRRKNRGASSQEIEDQIHRGVETEAENQLLQKFEQDVARENVQLDTLSQLMDDLNVQARSINQELRTQTDLIDHVSDQVDATNERVQRVKRRTEAIS